MNFSDYGIILSFAKYYHQTIILISHEEYHNLLNYKCFLKAWIFIIEANFISNYIGLKPAHFFHSMLCG